MVKSYATLFSITLLMLVSCGKEASLMKIERAPFAKLPDGRQVEQFTLVNAKGARATLINYGAIVTSLYMPDRNGKYDDMVLGFDTIDNYLKEPPYFGAIVGRYGNRIAHGRFTLDGKTHQLATNNGPNHLHGGPAGYDKVLWSAAPVQSDSAVGVKLSYLSRDGEEGYPGNLALHVTYWLTNLNQLRIDYEATTDQATLVNPTHHGYFNLAGQGEGDILGHELMIAADFFTAVDETLIPTGELQPVQGTPFDFTTATAIGARIQQSDQQLQYGGGYDHNWVLRKESGAPGLAATVYEAGSGRFMEVYTTEPGLQFYSGNFLDGTFVGKDGKRYNHRYGFCLEAQHYPDSPNKPDFPSVVLRPGETYSQTTIYQFSAR